MGDKFETNSIKIASAGSLLHNYRLSYNRLKVYFGEIVKNMEIECSANGRLRMQYCAAITQHYAISNLVNFGVFLLQNTAFALWRTDNACDTIFILCT